MSQRVKRCLAAGFAATVMLTASAGVASASPSSVGEVSTVAQSQSVRQGDVVYDIALHGGVTKIKKHWWGFAVFLNTQDANLVAGGGAAAAALLSRLGLPGAIASVILGIGTGALWACTGNKGAYIHAAWAGPSWCKRQ